MKMFTAKFPGWSLKQTGRTGKYPTSSLTLKRVLEAFGPARVMYGSDWPVCLVAASYEDQLAIIKQFIEALSPSEKRGIMGGNAGRFYHL
ncbi:MAG: amidohydrolase family protein [Bacteroidota bacterium]